MAIKASINRGLSNDLKMAFPYIIPMSRPLVLDQIIKDPYWLAGFTLFFLIFDQKKSGEGCFE